MKQRFINSTILQSRIFCFAAFSFLLLTERTQGQGASEAKSLTKKQKAITLISAFTAKGELTKLKQTLHAGLDAGLTVNECKRRNVA